MKKHAIIPIFIPHIGCGHSCVFCNQNIITARTKAPSVQDVRATIDMYLTTLSGRGLDTVEVSFFGGSFTGIPIADQRSYLAVAYEYKQKGLIDKIHMSTRPDYISEQILDMLKEYTTDTIELGVQSFDEEVLAASKRGHDEEAVYKACDLIKAYDIELGIQLMIGLPADTKEKAIISARKAAEIKPSLARLYPTVVLEDTELAGMFKKGLYTPLTEQQAVDITKEMYKILMDAGINIMRVGLKSTDLVTNDADLGCGYHPAFRQLVEGEICREQMVSYLSKLSEPALNGSKRMQKDNEFRTTDGSGSMKTVIFRANEKWFSPMIGHKALNKKYLTTHYPGFHIIFETDSSLNDGVVDFLYD